MYGSVEAGIRICARCNASYRDPQLTTCPRDGGALVVWRDDPVIGQVLGGRYQIVEPLGQGGMGSVYLAERLPDEVEVAIKIIRREHLANATVHERFLREVKHTSAIRSPHVVRIYDSGTSDDGRPYMVMERLVGECLTERVRRPPALSLDDGLHIAGNVARALAAAHAAGVVHRDLKPDNIFLCTDGTVKVVDFGIAKFIQNSQADQIALTIPGTIFGTPEYMSPEQARGDRLDVRSDIYSAGVVLWYLLLGRSPFKGKNIRETLTKVFSGKLLLLCVNTIL